MRTLSRSVGPRYEPRNATRRRPDGTAWPPSRPPVDGVAYSACPWLTTSTSSNACRQETRRPSSSWSAPTRPICSGWPRAWCRAAPSPRRSSRTPGWRSSVASSASKAALRSRRGCSTSCSIGRAVPPDESTEHRPSPDDDLGERFDANGAWATPPVPWAEEAENRLVAQHLAERVRELLPEPPRGAAPGAPVTRHRRSSRAGRLRAARRVRRQPTGVAAPGAGTPSPATRSGDALMRLRILATSASTRMPRRRRAHGRLP